MTDFRHGTVVLAGASRGIGAAAALHLAPFCRRLIGISRRPAVAGEWVEADLATDAGIGSVLRSVGSGPVDALLYMGGLWERGAFTPAYRFLDSPADEVRQVIAVNLVAPILLAQGLAPALALAPNPRVVLMGARAGRDPEVAYAASKFGLRGAAQAMDLTLRPMGIGVTLIDPDNVATREVVDDIAEGRFGAQVPLPMADILATLDYVLALGSDCVPTGIDLAQKWPG